MQEEKNYTWNAADYARHSSVQQVWARELVSKLGLNGTEKVLDLGCGDGKVTAEIGGLLTDGQVLGVDNSSAMIKLAREAFPREKHPNLSFMPGDANQLSFEEQFDVVFSNAALHWVIDHKPVLTGISKGLRRNGRVLLQMGGKGNAAAILAVLEKLIARKNWSHYFTGFAFPYGFYEPEQYREWLDEAGLKTIRTELIPKDMFYKDRDGLAGWIRTTWLPYTDRLPVDQRKPFISQLVEEYVKANPQDNNGRIHVGMVRLEVEAVKVV